MTVFQKLIIIILIILIGISGFYIYRQEQIKKDEFSFKEKQQKISDCKYLLANEELFRKNNVALLEEYQVASNGVYPEHKKLAQKLWEQYKKQSDEYRQSANECRELLRNLPNSDIKF